MASSSKPVRKILLFGNGDRDQALLDAVESELNKKHYDSFNELCKAALHQFLVSREPTQSVILFIELEKQIAALQHRVMALEDLDNASILERLKFLESQLDQVKGTHQPLEDDAPHLTDQAKTSPTLKEKQPVDPLLARLGPLLEEF